MDRKIFKKGPVSTLISGVGSIMFTLVIIVMIAIGLRQTEEANRAEGVRLLEEGILRAVVHSYAVKGHYPESIDYIVDKYKINIDKSKYVVHYEVFATNILPDIMVVELNR
jgi:hypothetical protein